MTTDSDLPFKFCPVCGNGGLEKTKENLLVCKKCNFEWYQNPTPGVNLLIYNEKNQVLLAKRGRDPGKGLYDFIGGFLDLNETVEQGLVRELKEETGLDVVSNKMTYFYNENSRYLYKNWNYHIITLFYTLKIEPNQVTSIVPSDDVAGVEFFSLEKIPWSQIADQTTANALKTFFSGDLTHN